ncbi:MAG: hypothetical protein CBD58_00070 [bacterium TMED198]|nr:MAG: hypothetical protein CBD58_00070 [bacterium TMED198]
MNMFAIDIGNTSTTCGLFYDNKLLSKSVFKKNDPFSVLSYMRANKSGALAVISSVDPSQTERLVKLLKKNSFKSKVISHNNCGLLMDVESTKEVGIDRVCNSYAAKELYKLPCLVIDFGTATTYDVINKDKIFIGGAIAPGIEVSSENLISKAALLNKVTYEIPKHVIGKNTLTNLQSGIVLGAVDSIDGMVKRIKKEIIENENLKIILTGGFSRIISPIIKFNHEINLDLTLMGINLIYLNENKTK